MREAARAGCVPDPNVLMSRSLLRTDSRNKMTWLWVMLGSAFGGVTRHWLSGLATHALGGSDVKHAPA